MENFQKVDVQRKLCVSCDSFAAIAYGGTITLGDAWWAWLIIDIRMMGFGALLEDENTPK